MCFTAWVDDTSYTISLEALATGALSSKYQLDCVIDPGKSVTGIVGYEVPKDWKEAKIEFTKEAIFGEKTVLLSVNKEEIRMERKAVNITGCPLGRMWGMAFCSAFRWQANSRHHLFAE